MTRFLHSGGAGDIIYSLPFVRHVGGGDFFVKPWNEHNKACDVYSAVRNLLNRQPYVGIVTRSDPGRKFFDHDPAVPVDMDLDRFRKFVSMKGEPLPLGYFKAFEQAPPADWKKPWLEVDRRLPCHERFAIVSRTARYQHPELNWAPIVDRAIERYGRVFFVGLGTEYGRFVAETKREIPWLHTEDLLDAAAYIAAADAVYCNQGPILTIAQALGKKCFLEVGPGYRWCVLGLEEILNA